LSDLVSIRTTGYRQDKPFGARIEPVESLLLFVGLVVILQTFRTYLLGADTVTNATAVAGEGGNLLFQAVTLAIYGPAVALLVLRMPAWLPNMLIASWPLLALVFLAALSGLWSPDLGTVLRRALALGLTMGFAIYVVARFEFSEFLRILFLACAFYVLCGYLASAIPGVGITPPGKHGYTWRGFTGFKNDFGRTLALILASGVVFAFVGPQPWRRFGLLLALFAAPLLYMTESSTAMLTAIAAIAGALCLGLVFQPRWGNIRFGLDLKILAVGIVLLSVFFVAAIGLETVAQAFGKTVTLSGRTKLWAYAFEIGLEQPILGSGFRAFWNDKLAATFTALFFWDDAVDSDLKTPGNGHNGYLDIFLELGLVGIVLYAILQISALRRIAACLQRGHMPEGIALAMIVSFLLIYSIPERVTLQHTEGVWFTFMLYYLYAGRAVHSAEGSAAGVMPRATNAGASRRRRARLRHQSPIHDQ
jgi:O-antigen ligase